jgi:hypothetical protein
MIGADPFGRCKNALLEQADARSPLSFRDRVFQQEGPRPGEPRHPVLANDSVENR